MRLGAAFEDIRLLTTSVIARRGVVVAVSALAQRMLLPAMAHVLFGGSVPMKLAFSLALSVVFMAHTLVMTVFGAHTEAELIQRAAAAVLDGSVLHTPTTSEEETRVEIIQATHHTAEVVAQTLPNLIADVISCIVLAGWIAVTEPARVVGFASALMIAAAVGLYFSQRSLERVVTRAWHLQRAAFATFVNVLDGRLEVLASGFRTTILSDLRRLTTAWGRAGGAVAGSSALAGRLPLLVIAALVAVALAISPWARHFTGATLADAALFASVTPAFAGVAQGMNGIAKAERWVGVLVGVVRSALPEARGAHAPGDITSHGIAFEQVSFRYESRQGDDVLRDVTFAWRGPGILALAGPNGSGKSTCLRLLLALASPSSGRIVVGGDMLEGVDADVWRRRIAFMPQRPYFPWRSDVREAVRWLAPASDDRIIQSLHRAGVFGSLRRGGRDPLSVKVDTLSIGERQRIALARMLCRDAALFVLDEPDANLDRAGISAVAGVLRDLAREHIVVIAAHTPDLLAVADRVVTLEAGCVVQDVPASDRRAGRK